jgi:aspartate kinase
MLELASAGAGVMHSRSIEFAKKFDVPIQVRSAFTDVEGTWIVPETAWMQALPVCGAALVKDEARVAISGVPDQPGISHRVFEAAAARNIVVDMIAQNVGSNGKAAIGFTVPSGEVPVTLEALRPLAREWGATVERDDEVSKVSIVGAGMRTHTGVAERMFAALSAEKINIKMITTADIKISVLVERKDGLRALRAVHQAFALAQARPGAGLPAAQSVQSPATHDMAALTQRLSNMEDILVSEVCLDADQGRITLFGLPDEPGHCSRVFQAVAAGGIVVDMIVQNHTGGRPELSFSVPQADLARALELTREVARSIVDNTEVLAESAIANVYVMGVGMRTHTGVARKMFGALARRGINISMINTSEVRLSVVVDRTRGAEALECLREAFHLG